MPMIHVTPAEGARVRMPERQSTVMPPDGAWVPRTVHYEHLLSVKDVSLTEPQPPFPNAAPAAVDPTADAPAPAATSSAKSRTSASAKEN